MLTKIFIQVVKHLIFSLYEDTNPTQTSDPIGFHKYVVINQRNVSPKRSWREWTLIYSSARKPNNLNANECTLQKIIKETTIKIHMFTCARNISIIFSFRR